MVLAGPALPIEIEELWDCLVARRHFVPEHVGLPDARTPNSGEQFHSDFAMHTMREIQLCSDPPTHHEATRSILRAFRASRREIGRVGPLKGVL